MAQTTTYILIKSFLLIFLISMSKPNPLTDQTNTSTGFSFDLIHRDSPESPYYDPSLSPAQAAINTIRRSLDRIQRLNQSLEENVDTYIERSLHNGDYLMRYGIGTRKVKALAVLDSGSDLLWLQCYPCRRCQKQSPPLYYWKKSTTYKPLSCASRGCNDPNFMKCNAERKCVFEYDYLDGTKCSGDIAEETLTLSAPTGGSVRIPHVVFGCATESNLKVYGYESGIAGLGRGPTSLASQLGKLGVVSKTVRFSYCMVSRHEQVRRSSKLNFAGNAEVSGRGTVRTPLVNMHRNKHYSVTLLGFSVAGVYHTIYSFEEGNMVVDSGTTLTMFPDDVYSALRIRMFSYWREKKVGMVKDPEGIYDMCFRASDDKETPPVILHFRDANVKLEEENLFYRTGPTSLCLAAMGAGKGRPGLLGYYSQTNFLVGYEYDIDNMGGWISFKPTVCAPY